MDKISVYILPIIVLLLVVLCLAKRIKVYDCFLDGAKSGLELVKNIFPYLAAIFICLQLFKQSGLSSMLANFLQKPLSWLGIPSQLAELVLLVPLSGNGTIALLEDIIMQYGVDSYVAKCAAVIAGASETIFYISAVYFSATKVRKLRYAIPVALVSIMLGNIAACVLCRFI